MRLLVLHGVADGFVVEQMENYRKSFIRKNRVEKISSEPDAVTKRATSGSRAIGSRPLLYTLVCAFVQGSGGQRDIFGLQRQKR